MLFGSNAHHVVRQATCPVLTVRPRRTAEPAREVSGGLVAASSAPTRASRLLSEALHDRGEGGRGMTHKTSLE